MSTNKPAKEKQQGISRRDFMNSAVAAAAFTIVPRHVLGGKAYAAPSDKLNIACIGVGGRGGANVNGVRRENIVAMCDVHIEHALKSFQNHPKAKRYRFCVLAVGSSNLYCIFFPQSSIYKSFFKVY